MADLIDRQATLKHIEKIRQGVQMMDDTHRASIIMNGMHLCEEAVRNQPSAEPKFDEWCTDCKEYDKERHCCPRWNRVIRQTLKDAELERKKGRWQITAAYPHNIYCSECHAKFAQKHWAVWEDGSLPRNFCPNCGAEMTEGENETY